MTPLQGAEVHMWTDSMLGLRKLWSWLTGLFGGGEAVEDRVVRREETRRRRNAGVPPQLNKSTATKHRMSERHEKRSHSIVIHNAINRYYLEIEYDDWSAKQQALGEVPTDPVDQINWAIENDDRDDFEVTVWTDDDTSQYVTNLLQQQ